MKNGKRSPLIVIGSIIVVGGILLGFALSDKQNQTASLYSTGRIRGTTDLSANYASKQACYDAQYAILTKGKTPSVRQLSLYRATAEKSCGIFGRLPAETSASVERSSPAHKGPSVQISPTPPNFAPIAISTPEKGKVLISIKNLGGAYTGNVPVEYNVVSWSGADPYRGGLAKDSTNAAVMSELGLGKPVGPTAKNVFSKEGVSFLLVTQSNSNIGLRTSANLIEVCVDSANKIKESNEGDNCKFQWTEYTPSTDLSVSDGSFNLALKRLMFAVVTKGDVDDDMSRLRDMYAELKLDGSSNRVVSTDMSNVFMFGAGTKMYVSFTKEKIDTLGLAAGPHTATMCADSKNVLSEIDETNNCVAVNFTW